MDSSSTRIIHSTHTTATLVEGASLIAETVNIPTLSIELAIGCIVEPSGGDAICQSVIGSGTAKVTDFQTVEFQPFPVAIGTDQPITSTASGKSDPDLILYNHFFHYLSYPFSYMDRVI